MFENEENDLSLIDRNWVCLRILTALIAIWRKVHSIGSPRRRVFTQPR